MEAELSPEADVSAMERGPIIAPDEALEGERIAEELLSIVLSRIKEDRLILPAAPATSLESIQMIEAENPNGLRKVIAGDPLLVVQLYYKAINGKGKPQSVEEVVDLLSNSRLRNALVEIGKFPLYESRSRRIRKAYNTIQQHTLSVALVARMIAQKVDCGVEPEIAYFTGLLHDIGKLVVASLFLEAEKMLGMPLKDWVSKDLWQKTVDRTHTEVGVALAEKWSLPDATVQAIRAHAQYSPKSTPVHALHKAQRCVDIVVLSCALAKRYGNPGDQCHDEDKIEDLIVEGVERFDLDWTYIHTTLRETIEGSTNSDAEAKEITQRLLEE